ncbi:hypothetical protein CMUS01_06620 [Colletotrichum musicola]|uniref:Uncharacterized protein n=1 Tax=Colletotrichum musicola TaxID=2175873 RepID=A0A8H6KKK2_9PEZI|nr:hypothetical protein CMUS01_06620 [Colletotrichum musicola]
MRIAGRWTGRIRCAAMQREVTVAQNNRSIGVGGYQQSQVVMSCREIRIEELSSRPLDWIGLESGPSPASAGGVLGLGIGAVPAAPVHQPPWGPDLQKPVFPSSGPDAVATAAIGSQLRMQLGSDMFLSQRQDVRWVPMSHCGFCPSSHVNHDAARPPISLSYRMEPDFTSQLSSRTLVGTPPTATDDDLLVSRNYGIRPSCPDTADGDKTVSRWDGK